MPPRWTFCARNDHLLELFRQQIPELDVWLHPVGPFPLANHITGIRKDLGIIGCEGAEHVIQMRVGKDDRVDFFGSDTEVSQMIGQVSTRGSKVRPHAVVDENLVFSGVYIQ
jgi:hypothetical protein